MSNGGGFYIIRGIISKIMQNVFTAALNNEFLTAMKVAAGVKMCLISIDWIHGILSVM